MPILETMNLVVAISAILFGYFLFDYHRRLKKYQRLKRMFDNDFPRQNPSLPSSSSSSSSTPPPPSRRLLSGTEMYFEQRQLTDDWIDTNAAFIESVDAAIDEALLRRALIRVAAAHPLLRAKIRAVDEDGRIIDLVHSG